VGHYRLFFVDAIGRIEEERAFEAASDSEAKRVAGEWRGRRPAELSNTHGRIARWCRFMWQSFESQFARRRRGKAIITSP